MRESGTVAVSSSELSSATDRAVVASRLAISVGRINRRIRPAADALSYGLLSALSTIVRLGPLRPSDLARLETVAAPTVTRALGELENRGLTLRTADPADGRSTLIEATDAGAAAVLRARAERADRIGALIAELDDEQIGQIAGALDALEAASKMNPV